MRLGGWAMMLGALALAGCKDAAPTPATTAAAPATQTADSEVAGPQLNVLAFGDSLFAGYGLPDPARQSYTARLEAVLRDAGHNVRIANAGVSGDTTAAGLQRLAFTLDSQSAKPGAVLLELGGNDMLRGLPPEQTRKNLSAMLDELKKRGIPVILMGLQAPPNYGADWQRKFDAIYPALAKQYGAALVPFVTAQVFTDPSLIQADHVHPTAQGVEKLVAATEGDVAKALPKPR